MIVCGYGRVGKNAVSFLRQQGIGCVAIELDADLVRQAAAAKEPVSFGDADSLKLLQACGLSRAALVVVSMSDFNTAMKIVRRVRSVDSELPIIVRARKEIHLFDLYQAGASDVVTDQFDTRHMLNREMLERFHILDSDEEAKE